MRKTVKKTKIPHSKNQIIFFVVTLCLFIGVVIGAIMSNIIKQTESDSLRQYVDNFFINFDIYEIDKTQMFKDALFKYGKIVIIIWFLGFINVGSIITLLILGAKGISYGFTTGFLAKCYGASGIYYGSIMYLFQNIVIIPAYMFVAYESIKYILNNYDKSRNKQPNNSQTLINYMIALFIGMSCILLASLFEAYAIPDFIYHYISKFF